MLRYAETGEGDLHRLATDEAVTVRLRIGAFFVRLSLDQFEGVMHVWTVYRPGVSKRS